MVSTVLFTLLWMACSVTSSDVMDASDVTWAHAVNSRAELESELKGSADFLEADVNWGLMQPFGQLQPIMAHPPSSKSDISLAMFLDMVIASGTGKGIKLDFKRMEAVEPSLILLKEKADKINGSLWLNADIIYGPIRPAYPPLGDIFISLCQDYLPDAVLSLGWTTLWLPTFPPDTWHYEWGQIRKMADLIRCARFDHSNSSYTFPVRGIFASRSINKMQWLLDVIPDSTLTVWTFKLDPLNLDDLITIRKSFPKDKVYYDIPQNLQSEFTRSKDKVETVVVGPGLSPGQWIKLTKGQRHNHGPSCITHTYITDRTIMFGSSLPTAVLLKKLWHLDGSRYLRAEGRIQFFTGDNQDLVSPQELSIVVIDVRAHFKNSSTTMAKDLDMSEGDTDVWWSAIKTSVLYTFSQNSSDSVRIFKLDSTKDRAFQAWTVPLYAIEDHSSIGDVTTSGTAEVPYSKTVVLPDGPFMIGFVSSGSGHVVIEDLVIEDVAGPDIPASASSSLLRISIGILVLSLTALLATKSWVLH